MVTLDALNRALRHVQRELDAAGLFEGCLDQIEVVLAYWPSGWWGECGFVYDRGVSGLAVLAGFREGVIYVPWNAPISRRRGETLRDVLRHEYAHALAWVRPSFVRGKWFREAFGAGYDEEWDARPAFDPKVYVSEYATVSAKEDFAETFMCRHVVRAHEASAAHFETCETGIRRSPVPPHVTALLDVKGVGKR